MSTIRRSRAHSLDAAHAKASAEEIAKELSHKYDINYQWRGSNIYFKGTGVKGVLCVREREMEIEIELSLLLRPLKTKIEGAVERYLDEFCA